jgi:23S rRNA-/tRNA-specific pseudouridylate synthase
MIPIIFENEDMLVLNKPAGISVHKDGKHDEYTVADYILEHYPQLDGVGEDTLIPEKQEQKIKPKMWKGQIEDPGFAFKTRKERMNQKKQKSEDLSSENSDTESEAEPLPAIKSVIKRPGIVHRLDKETSGCLVIAKNQKSYNHLKKQFHDREVKKEYVAIVYGWPKNDTGIIDTPIARSKSDLVARR